MVDHNCQVRLYQMFAAIHVGVSYTEPFLSEIERNVILTAVAVELSWLIFQKVWNLSLKCGLTGGSWHGILCSFYPGFIYIGFGVHNTCFLVLTWYPINPILINPFDNDLLIQYKSLWSQQWKIEYAHEISIYPLK